MRIRWVLLLVSFVSTAVAQSGPCTEAAIRSATESDKYAQSEDAYFFSERYNQPMIGKTAIHESKPPVAMKNENYSPLKPDRIVAAPSGDMAYEYGTRHVSRDVAETGKHQDFSVPGITSNGGQVTAPSLLLHSLNLPPSVPAQPMGMLLATS